MHINDASSSSAYRLSGIGSSPSVPPSQYKRQRLSVSNSSHPPSAQFTPPSPDFSSQQSNDLSANRFFSSQTTPLSNPPSISSSSTSNGQEEIDNLRVLLELDDSSLGRLPSNYPDPWPQQFIEPLSSRPPFPIFSSQQSNDLSANRFFSSQTTLLSNPPSISLSFTSNGQEEIHKQAMHAWNTPQAFFTGSSGVNANYSDVIISEGASSAPGPCIDQSKPASAIFIQKMSDSVSTDKEPKQLADPNPIDWHPLQRGDEDDEIFNDFLEKDAYITSDEIGNENIKKTIRLNNNINPYINSNIIAELIDKGYSTILIIDNLIKRARNSRRSLTYQSARQQIYNATRYTIYKDRLNNNNNIAKQNKFTPLSNNINPSINSEIIAELINKGYSTVLIINHLIEQALSNGRGLLYKNAEKQICEAIKDNIYKEILSNNNNNIAKQKKFIASSNDLRNKDNYFYA